MECLGFLKGVAAAAAAMEEAVDDGINPHIRANHIKKRALKNKSLSVSFNEKDLKYVSQLLFI